MKTRYGATLLAACAALAPGCAARPAFRADPALLVTWSAEAQERFPEPPYVARYERRGRALSFVAALHEHRPESATFRLVERELALLAPEAVVIEGLASAHGPAPGFYRELVASTAQDEVRLLGEAGHAAALATARGIPFVGGEPTPREVSGALVRGPDDLRDLIHYYVVRQIPQWKRTGADRGRTFDELYTQFIADQARAHGFEPGAFADPRAFEAWYEEKNGRRFVYEEITTEEGAPIESEGALPRTRWRGASAACATPTSRASSPDCSSATRACWSCTARATTFSSSSSWRTCSARRSGSRARPTFPRRTLRRRPAAARRSSRKGPGPPRARVSCGHPDRAPPRQRGCRVLAGRRTRLPARDLGPEPGARREHAKERQ